MTSSEIRRRLCNPPILAEKDQYCIKFAVEPWEIEAVYRLRYRVFKLEQGKHVKDGESGIDRDPFDDYCLHLVVLEKERREICGTYRVHLGPVARESELGFYSSGEFDIRGLDAIALQTMEVGRSCVAPEYRNGTVVALLWAGISETLARAGLRYLTGCVSLEDVDPAIGWTLYDLFKEQHRLSDQVTGIPLPCCKMERPSEAEMDAFKSAHPLTGKLIPPLFKGYLRLGAKICSEPVFDRDFGTIDFLILLDAGKLPERYQKHFNVVTPS